MFNVLKDFWQWYNNNLYKNVYESDKWKNIHQNRSSKGAQFDPIYLLRRESFSELRLNLSLSEAGNIFKSIFEYLFLPFHSQVLHLSVLVL